MELEIEHKFAIVAVIALVFCVGSAITYSYYAATITTQGTIIDINVETNVDFIDWGVVEPGQFSNVSVQATTIGNTPITLQFTASNWNPAEIQPYLALSWNYTGATISPNEWVSIEFSLYVSDTITNGFTDFSFDIVIEGIPA